MVGIEDIFYEEKRYYNQMALELYPQLKKYVEQSKNRLETALRIAIAGNIIDLGVYKEVKVNEILYQIEHTPWGIYDWDDFQADLESSKILLYIGDNAGEVVFDRVFLEEINQGRKIYFIVKERPISNDALREDAIEAGIDKVATILTTGQGEICLLYTSCVNASICSIWFRYIWEKYSISTLSTRFYGIGCRY